MGDLPLEIADLIFLAIVAISAIIGLFRGFVREALSLAAWIVAFFVALKFGPLLAEYLADYISVPSVRMATAYCGLFLGTLVIGAIINYFLGKMVRATGFAGTDRVLGFVFGMARGVALLIIAIMLARMTVVREDPWWKESLVIQYLEPWAVKAQEWLPDNMDKELEQLNKPGEPAKQTEKQSSKKPDYFSHSSLSS